MKRCTRCKKVKQLEEYYDSTSTYDNKQERCKQCKVLTNNLYGRLLKMEFILAYGGCCSCCGEYNIDLLTVQHIKGRGHELVYGNSSRSTIMTLKRKGWPEGYTCLCYNCNCSIKMGSPCVHTQEYEAYKKKFESLFTDKEKSRYNILKHKLQIMNYKRKIA